MAETSPAEEFNDQAAAKPPMLSADAYVSLLEKLVGEGKGFGKTESVVAYFLSPMRFDEERQDAPDKKHFVPVKPIYVVMDLKEWPNDYGRSLVMKEIGAQYMARMVGERDMNAPDFKAPGLWTSKPGAFEFDYLPRKDASGNDVPHYYDPNPDAFRVCLTMKAPATIPTAWGEPWTIGTGGALAVREQDVPALAAALQDIRSGRQDAASALFVTEDGLTKTKFDVYGMMPGFLEDNYKPVALKPVTLDAVRPFAPAQKKTMAVLKLKTPAT